MGAAPTAEGPATSRTTAAKPATSRTTAERGVLEAGSRSVGRQHEVWLADTVRDLLAQGHRALERRPKGTYGRRERCRAASSAARPHASPRVAPCVACQPEERR